MPKPILINLQFGPHDFFQAMELARLICDLRDGPDDIADLMFCPRFDISVDTITLEMAKQKFKRVYVRRTTRRITGWPGGCNAQAHESYEIFAKAHKRKEWDYAAMLWAEADCVPLAKDWINQLHADWHSGTQKVLGYWVTQEEFPVAHINGNCLISPDFGDIEPSFKEPPKGAWDIEHSGVLMKHGRATTKIYSCYRLGTPENPWRGCDFLWEERKPFSQSPIADQMIKPVWFHGVKPLDGLKCARQKLLKNA